MDLFSLHSFFIEIATNLLLHIVSTYRVIQKRSQEKSEEGVDSDATFVAGGPEKYANSDCGARKNAFSFQEKTERNSGDRVLRGMREHSGAEALSPVCDQSQQGSFGCDQQHPGEAFVTVA